MEKQRCEESRRRRKEVRRSEKRKREKKEDAGARKVAKSRFTVFFQWFMALEGRKAGPLKWRVQSHLARWEMKSCTPLWREANVEFKMYKATQLRITFRSWDVEKVYAVVVRSTFPSQNVQSTPFLDHLWKLRCRKSARRGGAKHMSKSNAQTHQCRSTFWSSDVGKVHAILARGTCLSQNVQSTPFPDHFLKLRCRKSARHCGAKHISKSKLTGSDNFWRSEVEKVSAVVARSRFGRQKCQKLGVLKPFLTFRCRKSAHWLI